MKTKLSNILIGLQAVAALCVMGAVKFWAPVCSKMLTLESGNPTHMKCFYAGQAAVAVAVILLAAAVLALLSRQNHRKLMLVGAVAAVILFLLFGNLIGICANTEMSCHATALWCRGAAIVTLIAAAVEFLGNKDGQIPA